MGCRPGRCQAIEDATAILEDLVGGRSPHPSLSERLKEAVETSAMLAAEMSSMQRQHASIALMLRQEEAHVAEARGALADLRERMGRVDAVEKNNYVLQEERNRALSQRDEFARQLGKDPAKLFPPGGNLVLPGEQAMKYAQILEKRMKVRAVAPMRSPWRPPRTQQRSVRCLPYHGGQTAAA